jgi:hypothetical protein
VVRKNEEVTQPSKSALGAAFRRIARHKGGAVAVFAIARKLATLVYRMLHYGQDYIDVGCEAERRWFLKSLRVSFRSVCRHALV